MNKINISMLPFVAAVCSNAAYALDLGHNVSLKGFGTLGIVNNSTNDADFVANALSQPRGAGLTESLSVNPDSRLGLQMDWQAIQRLSFTAQAVSKQGPDNSWVPELQLGFAKFKVLSDLEIRGGRIRPPFFMMSDYLDMFYANPWIRPPTEFYSLVPIASHTEGVDLLYRPQTGPISWLIQPYYGNTQLPLRLNTSITAQNMAGINISATVSDFTLRAGYTHLLMSYTDPTFNRDALPALTQLCGLDPAICPLQSSLAINNSGLTIVALGANWDNGDYFITGELGKRISQNNVIDTTAGYISSGARLGKFTPYVTYSSTVNNSPTTFSGGTGPYAALSNQVVTDIVSQLNFMDQNTKTLGIRYDFYKNLALKVQWDRIDTSTKNGQAETGWGLFNNSTTTFANSNNAIDLFSTSVDFVF
jgi:hypothetical protein